MAREKKISRRCKITIKQKNVFKTNVNKKIYIKEFHLDKNITIKKKDILCPNTMDSKQVK